MIKLLFTENSFYFTDNLADRVWELIIHEVKYQQKVFVF